MRQAEMSAKVIVDRLGLEVGLSPMVTTGDKQASWSLEERGGKGLFTKELELAVLERRADLAVHSAKDLPTEMPDGLVLAGFLPREDPCDVLVIREDVDVPKVIATGSPRRRAQLSVRFPEVEWIELRGNVETRLLRIAELQEADATVLAAAGLKRLAIANFPGLRFESLPLEQNVPAAGQAAIALQCRSSESDRFLKVCHEATGRAVNLERAVLEAMGGGCHLAMGVHVQDDKLLVYHEKHGSHLVEVTGFSQEESVERAMQSMGLA
ncbi:MAG: hydroxymethylbilane synthase [Opitutae bacterium]|nr:hydroxymethylbilane synthase [Opitutae bacterium]|tara:strand:- start:981 stop:1784 length:804 start_codon:yes stop_codon:yes gene_type:complete